MTASTGGPVPRRLYRDDVELSVVGMGGIVLMGMEQGEADRNVAEAIECGVNYYDVAPSYGKGEAEAKLGPALEPFRDDVFLACKTHARDAKTAREHLDSSLRVLRTDHFDLYQFHGLSSVEEAEQVLAPGGAAETFCKAREEGKVHYLGFSAHSEEAALKMIDEMPLDSVLLPINFNCIERGGFGPRVIQRAKQAGLARLSLKALALRPWDEGEERIYDKCWYRPLDDPGLIRLALRYTLAQDVTAAVMPGNERIFWMGVDAAADGVAPLRDKERDELLARTEGACPIFPDS